jgi:hypothetical protein
MVEFRRWILALTVLGLFAGLASAQVGGGGGQLTCATNTPSVPVIRAEGYTERTADITVICIGGPAPVLGTVIPTVNITVSLNTAVTSRLLPVDAFPTTGISEALLMIDEPGSGAPSVAPGFGSDAQQSLCPTPLTGCMEFVSTVTPSSGFFAGIPVPVATNDAEGTTATTPGYNVFQGVVNNNQVTFFGVPVLARSSDR